MLEVRNLKRVYKVKGGSSVYALNDVSLKFPETGLVFILGKSGSGKSTLLNVMGGLDEADEGEIIINGKSSQSFSKGEMDSYRNTYLGFIFQEYNILNDFSVKENIGLALQLQHKKATDEAIEEILQEVDLGGYGKRKPNELSGGQKQRVAIARALVKDPKIIFGDEPTGALDSNTGKQVFETLKSLAKDRLVIIVSHDRDFAEHFGDRVIELKDGKVISDISKTAVKSQVTEDGLSLIGDNIIRLNKDRTLKAEDLPFINEAIKNSGGDVYIVGDPHVNGAICEAAKIDKDGNREEFVDTDPSKVKTGEGKFEPIKSKFSLSSAFRMGAKSLRVKPFRLVMTILLSTIAFSLFGASMTLSLFNAQSAMKSTITKGDISIFGVSANDKTYSSGLNDERIKEIEETTGVKLFVAENASGQLPLPSSTASSTDLFHARRISSRINVSEGDLKTLGFSIVAGKMPSTDDECLLPLYAYWSFKDLGYASGINSVEASKVNEETIIGTSLSVYDSTSGASSTYTISGIIDTKFPDHLASYRNKISDISYGDADGTEFYYLSQGYNPNTHTSLYMKEPSQKAVVDDIELDSRPLIAGEDENERYYYLAYYSSHSGSNYFFDKSKTSLEEGEAVITISKAVELVNEMKEKGGDGLSTEEGSFIYAIDQIFNNYDSFTENYVKEHFDELYEECKKIDDFQRILEANPEYSENEENLIAFTWSYLAYGDGKNTEPGKKVAASWEKEEKSYLDAITEEVKLDKIVGTLPTKKGNNYEECKESWSFSIVGLDFKGNDGFYKDSFLSISKSDMDSIIDKLKANGYGINDGTRSRVGFVTYGGSEITLDKFLNFYFSKSRVFTEASDYSEIPDTAWRLTMSSNRLSMVESYASLISILTQVFLYVGIAMAVFSMLLFYNFISISINNKKREIGILRAVGAKRSDVFKIFYSEAFIIAFVNFILSTVSVFAISRLVSNSVIKSTGLPFDLMSPNILVVLALLGAALISSIISAFLPVTKIANKKPIDAIQNR